MDTPTLLSVFETDVHFGTKVRTCRAALRNHGTRLPPFRPNTQQTKCYR